MTNTELDKKACKLFVCPNMGLIDGVCKKIAEFKENSPVEIGAPCDSEEMTNVSRAIATEYFKRTYHKPRYSAPAPVLMGCIYIAGKATGNWVTQGVIRKSGSYSATTVRKWTLDILNELGTDLGEIVKRSMKQPDPEHDYNNVL
jgi:hypothetical protein